jgi:hypothetical protein
MIRLTREQAEEAARHPAGLRVEAEGCTKTFVLVEEELLQRMQRAFERNQSRESLDRAIAQMEAGEGRTLEEVDAGVRAELGLPPRELP